MSGEKRRRGRPKGTGIDDWERLLSIASLIERNPKLKVTTAIKELGFADPSVIRRLRDKYKAHQARLSQARLADMQLPQVRHSQSGAYNRFRSAEATAGVSEDTSALVNSKPHSAPRQIKKVCIEDQSNVGHTLAHPAKSLQLDADQANRPSCLLAGARATAAIYSFQAHALDYLVNQPAKSMSVEQQETVLKLMLGAFEHATQALCD